MFCRPIAGHLSICKASLTGQDYNKLSGRIQHEMLHALVGVRTLVITNSPIC